MNDNTDSDVQNQAVTHYFPHRAIDGSWHVVYRLPGCKSLQSVETGFSSEASASAAACVLNGELPALAG